MSDVKIERALLSVSDKSGLAELGAALAARGVELVSTGGTARALREAGLAVKDVSELTGFPEMMDGRVKTLHPTVHGGILAVRDDPAHAASMAEHGIGAIDLLVVNLYPFEATVARGAERDEVVENIDIGGPSMVRSAAKNHAYVTIVTDPGDYAALLAELDVTDGATTLAFRKAMAAKAFAATASYDAAIASWFAVQRQDKFPETIVVAFERAQLLRYGENPGQAAAFYTERPGVGLAALKQRGGKELSFNNLLDLEGALLAVDPFERNTACAIVKHTTPCGLAIGSSALDAYRKALACDPVSAFGSVIAGTALLGAVGALIAIPATATLQGFLAAYVRRYDVTDPRA